MDASRQAIVPCLVAVMALNWTARPGPVAAQRTAVAPEFVWKPRLPLQGSLVVVSVRTMGDSVGQIRGELAGEPLHFEAVGGWYRAVGGIPLDAASQVTARVLIDLRGGGQDSVTRAIAVRRRRTRSERLRMNPDFVQPPESLAPRIQAERVLVRELKQGAHDLPRLWDQPFVRPRPGPVTSGFGIRRTYNGRLRSRHLGVDFDGAKGDPVLAANRGIVAYAGDLYYSGTTVFIDHGAGLLSAYFHLSRALVALGDTVSPGQVIGLIGSTGRATGPHLHWFAAYGSVTVDPLELLRLELTPPQVSGASSGAGSPPR